MFSIPSARSADVPLRGGVFLLCLIVGTACGILRDSSKEEAASYKRIGYIFGERGVDLSAQDVKQLTHVNYAFANVTEEGRVVLEMEGDSTRLAKLTTLRDRTSDFDLLLSIGGWEWSDHFSDAALTEESRARFARTAVRLLDKHDLDGLDIDWEYPGQEGQDNVYRPEDKENFTRLLRTVRRHLDEHAAQEGREDAYLLTIAAGAGPSFIENTNMAAAQAPLDFVNLMTYDFHGSWTAHTGHHANLYPPSPPDTAHPQRAASRAVDLFLEAGVPSDKLVLGVPFYGRAWSGVEPENNGLYQSYSSPRDGFSYDTLATHIIDQQGFTRHWHEAAKAPYLWNADSSIVVSYEDPASLRAKARFVKDRGLAGMMYWEHSEDNGTLLQALYDELRR